MLDPNDFVITRKRKKYKFALFANSPLCFEADQWVKRPVDVVELGAGTGLFAVEHAARHPDIVYVAVDVKADRLQHGARRAEELGLTNIYFVRARANQLLDICEPCSLRALWLTFPDPFPKKRSASRRMTHSRYLALFAALLTNEGAFYFKHDSRDFFCWSLEQLVLAQWHLVDLTFDLHESDLMDEYKIQTVYEARWIEEGNAINFVKATPPREKQWSTP